MCGLRVNEQSCGSGLGLLMQCPHKCRWGDWVWHTALVATPVHGCWTHFEFLPYPSSRRRVYSLEWIRKCRGWPQQKVEVSWVCEVWCWEAQQGFLGMRLRMCCRFSIHRTLAQNRPLNHANPSPPSNQQHITLRPAKRYRVCDLTTESQAQASGGRTTCSVFQNWDLQALSR